MCIRDSSNDVFDVVVNVVVGNSSSDSCIFTKSVVIIESVIVVIGCKGISKFAAWVLFRTILPAEEVNIVFSSDLE